MRTRCLFIGLCFTIGCSPSGPTTDPDGGTNPDVLVYTSNRDCRAPLLTGGAEGTPCIFPDDCAEVCCRCSNDARSFSARACIDGRCAASAQACPRGQQTTAICGP